MSLARLYTICNLVVLTIVIYGGVDIFYTLAESKLGEFKAKGRVTARGQTPVSPGSRPSFGQYQPAIDRNLFGAAEESVAKKDELKIQDLEPTTLKVALLGTVSGDDQTATAIIEDKAKRRQDLYKEGDAIQNATIVKILRGKVVLRVQDKDQILTMEEEPQPSSSRATLSPRSRPTSSTPAAAPTGGTEQGSTISLDRAVVAKSMENLTELLSQVRVRPHYRDGKTDGLLLSQVKPNTVFTQLGLRNGDIIQSFDGESLGSPDDIMDFYEELKSGSPVSLEIMRRGKKQTLTYEFK